MDETKIIGWDEVEDLTADKNGQLPLFVFSDEGETEEAA